MISVSGLGKSFGAQILFSDVSFQLNPGERYGLVGSNGSGKTTLLNILSGYDSPSEGSVSLPRRINLGVLRQDQFLYEEESILGVTMMGNQELWQAISEKESLLAGDAESFDAERFSELEEIVQQHDGYAAEARAAEILEGLGLPTEVHHQPLATLSGGFKLRVLLAQVLAGSPDALLLDEPTNHLDILSIRWLEKFLKEFGGPVLVISHDHRFLDYVCTHILDVDYQTVLPYKGNYTKFIEAKQAERERREREIDKREKEIAHHKQFIDRFRAKSSKARQAQSKLRLIEKKAEGLGELPQSSRRYPTFTLKQTRPSGREVLKLEGIKKAFGNNEVLHGVDLTVRRGDRLAIMGPNGIGKSTLLKIAVGELEPDAGDLEWGYETHPGYFAQDHRDQLQPGNRSAEAWIWEFCPGELIGYVRNQLGRVLFSGDEAKKPLKALSGGEAARLLFCKLAVQQPNVLVLDEPTNHLDLESIEALVEGLQSYPGTLIFVSHDRWFVSQLASRILEIKPGEVLDYEGTYEEYVHYCGDDHLDVDTVILKARREKRQAKAAERADADEGGGRQSAPVHDGRKPKKISKNKLRQMRGRSDKLLAEIEKAEARIEEINQVFCDPAFYEQNEQAEVRRLEEEQKNLRRKVESLTSEWEAAEEELARFQ
jgi:ATPase subunit of ABC transporter with duplicated ATPase domains